MLSSGVIVIVIFKLPFSSTDDEHSAELAQIISEAPLASFEEREVKPPSEPELNASSPPEPEPEFSGLNGARTLGLINTSPVKELPVEAAPAEYAVESPAKEPLQEPETVSPLRQKVIKMDEGEGKFLSKLEIVNFYAIRYIIMRIV